MEPKKAWSATVTLVTVKTHSYPAKLLYAVTKRYCVNGHYQCGSFKYYDTQYAFTCIKDSPQSNVN